MAFSFDASKRERLVPPKAGRSPYSFPSAKDQITHRCSSGFSVGWKGSAVTAFPAMWSVGTGRQFHTRACCLSSTGSDRHLHRPGSLSCCVFKVRTALASWLLRGEQRTIVRTYLQRRSMPIGSTFESAQARGQNETAGHSKVTTGVDLSLGYAIGSDYLFSNDWVSPAWSSWPTQFVPLATSCGLPS